MKKQWVAILAVVIIIAMIAGFAIAYAKQEKQGKQAQKGQQWEKGKGKGKGYGYATQEDFWKKMNITDEQKEKMKAQKLAFAKVTLPIRNDLGVKKIELQELWSVAEPDAKKIVAKQKEIGDLMAKLSEQSVYHRIEMGKIFTPEQKKMMKAGMDKKMGATNRGQKAGCDMGMQGSKMGMGKGQGMGKQMNPNCPMNK